MADNASHCDEHVDCTSPSRQTAMKVVYLVIGCVGAVDNLFVILIFASFVKITGKTMNILVVNQSIVDLCASVFLLLTTAIEVKPTGMSDDNVWDVLLCRSWIAKLPLWAMLTTSTYGILLITLDRYVAVIYPVWYKNNIFIFVAFIWHVADFGSWLYDFTTILVFANSCINPFIYAAKYWEFQQAVRQLSLKLHRNSPQISLNSM